MLASAHDDVDIGVAKRVIWQGIVASEVQRETERNREVQGRSQTSSTITSRVWPVSFP